MKKSAVIIIAVFSVIISSHFVAAFSLPAPPAAFNSMAEMFRELLVSEGGDDLIARVLLIMLLTTVLFRPAMNFTGKKTGMAFLVAFIVSVLGVRFFTTNESIMGLLLPYSALAITLSATIPFLLIAYLIEDSDLDSLIRKFMFGVMAAAFISLWWLRWTNIGELAYVYLAIGVVSLFILLFLDSTLHRWFYLKGTGVMPQIAAEAALHEVDSTIEGLTEKLRSLEGSALTKAEREIKRLKNVKKALASIRD